MLLAIAVILPASAQTNPVPTIKGTLGIQYNTRTGAPVKGVTKDIYTLNLNVANSVLFHGQIFDRPQVIEGMFSPAVTQPRSLKYDVSCDVVNPKNISQTRNIGRMFGEVQINSSGTYNYDGGSLIMDILPMGNAGGFTSKFSGLAEGKPLVRPSNWTDTIRQTVNITRSVNGKTMTVSLKRYDKMNFRQVVLAQGPVQIYQSVTVNGEMLYDYDKNCWFFNNFTVQFAEGGIVKIDRISGTIRYVLDANYKANKLSQYEFDLRVNEPTPDAASAFNAPSDESAFFSTDTTVAGLTGTMKYKDTVSANDVTTSSDIVIDLTGNNITKQQTMVLGKVIIFAAIVPMNAD